MDFVKQYALDIVASTARMPQKFGPIDSMFQSRSMNFCTLPMALVGKVATTST